jgi:hypothetical protein
MAKDWEVRGDKKVRANIRRFRNTRIGKVIIHVANTAEQVANHAKSDHLPGFAHAVGRYANRTTNLTNSINPKPVSVTEDEVVYEVIAAREYAAFVELGTAKSAAYPYMFPALQAKRAFFIDGLKAKLI